MQTNNKLEKKDILNNCLIAENRIKLNFHNGYLDGNIIEEPIPLITCIENALVFTCEENSQYIPLI